MAEMWETAKTRDFSIDANSTSVEINVFVRGSFDEREVEALIRTRTPRVFRRCIRQGYKTDRVGPSEWQCQVSYGTTVPGTADPPTSPSQFLTNSFTWDTTGQTAHINQSIKTLSKTDKRRTTLGTKANNFTLDNQRAIGISKDGVAGTDKLLPQFQWTYEQRLLFCTGSYMVVVAGLVGTINSTKFFGFAPGEVLYLGANGRYTADDGWTVTHKFLSIATRKNIRISEDITVAEKRGHDYLWVGYVPKLVGQAILQVPSAAYVEQVYEDGHFWFLGIGGVDKADAMRALEDGMADGDGKGQKVRKPKRIITGRPPSNFKIEKDLDVDGGEVIVISDNVVPAAETQNLFR